MPEQVHIFSEFEDPERIQYINEIAARQPGIFKTVRRASLFPLWFAEKELLRKIATDADNSHLQRLTTRQLQTPLLGLGYDPVAATYSGEIKWDPALVDNVLKRDQRQCVLTKYRQFGIEAAHIVPSKLHRYTQGFLWLVLSEYWPLKSKAWSEAILRKGWGDNCFNTERLTNMLTLNQMIHWHWENCHCAFYPIRVADDKKSMDLSFHWLPSAKGMKASDWVHLDRNPFGDTRPLEAWGTNVAAFNVETRQLISSGDIFTITTPDPEKLPLPSIELLEMMWHLKRIASMRGQDDEEEEKNEEDEDDDEEDEEDETDE
ncbi:uncharacterized protein N7483_012269 [Penicillium malachiteum]|uniref:uncharacterized protein n=1 Tax=Penicillium malachiteum TaxID=1324776 RepID=UPI002549A304|nr:uncharacterized protein N7483_012269 [Penicillium malachiteum]KAJ5715088.1 hypothetical protein N7483_012269 [Penicillium malachiteum]